MLTRFFLPNLRARLVAIIFLALLPAFVLLLTVASLERSRAMENARLETMAIAQLTKTYYEDLISAAEQMMSWLAQFPEIRSNDPVACEARIERLAASFQDDRVITVSHPSGEVWCAWPRVGVEDMPSSAGQPFFERTLATGDFTVGGFALASDSGASRLTFGYPITDAVGQVTGVVGLGLDAEALAGRLSDSRFYDSVALLVIDSHGIVVLRHPDPEQFAGQNASDLPLFLTAKQEQQGYVELPGLANIRRLWAFTTIGDPATPELYVMAGFTESYVLEGVNRMLRSTLLGLSVIGLVALVAAWASAEMMIVRRTERVVDAAERMRAGDFSARVGLTDDASEVGQLAQTFDEMAAALEQREKDNRELLEEMQRLNAELEIRVVKRTEQLQISNSRLLESQGELRRLSADLMRVAEQERSRISRDIHDQLGQLLTAIKMELRNLQKEIDSDRPDATNRIRATVDLIDETIRTVRRISADLRPGILDDFGLAAALDWQLQEWGNRTGVEWGLDAQLDEERITRETATAAFRICQEALTNVARHAEATRVTVSLQTGPEFFEVVIQDNGKGLPPPDQRRQNSLGIVGMRERARQLGGSVDLSGAPGEGTTVRLRFPLASSDDNQRKQD